MKIGMLLEGLLNVQPFQFFSLLTLLRNSITIKKHYNSITSYKIKTSDKEVTAINK